MAHLPPIHLKCPHPVLGRKHGEWAPRIAELRSSAYSTEESGLTDPRGQPARWAPQALVPPAGETVCWPQSREPCSPLPLEEEQVNTSFLWAGGAEGSQGTGDRHGDQIFGT